MAIAIFRLIRIWIDEHKFVHLLNVDWPRWVENLTVKIVSYFIIYVVILSNLPWKGHFYFK